MTACDGKKNKFSPGDVLKHKTLGKVVYDPHPKDIGVGSTLRVRSKGLMDFVDQKDCTHWEWEEGVRLSIVIAILNSHEIVRRQLYYFAQMDLPDDIEIIFVDDGSDPPLETYDDFSDTDAAIDIMEAFDIKFNFMMLRTNDFREWTQPAARNFGVKKASGEKVIVTDIDHILHRDLIDFVYNDTKYSWIKFRREAAVLLEDGTFTQDEEELRRWGLHEKYVHRKKMGPHTNSFAIDRKLYLQHGGVSERLVGTGKYPNREEQTIRARMRNDARKGRIKFLDKISDNQDERPVLYMFPNGRFCGDRDYNPFGFFHKLSREKWWRKDAKGPGKDGFRRD